MVNYCHQQGAADLRVIDSRFVSVLRWIRIPLLTLSMKLIDVSGGSFLYAV